MDIEVDRCGEKMDMVPHVELNLKRFCDLYCPLSQSVLLTSVNDSTLIVLWKEVYLLDHRGATLYI
jgi:hypothetical protein